MKKLVLAAVLAASALGATAPAAVARPYWRYHHRYWGWGPYWGPRYRPYYYGYGPYWGGPWGPYPYHRCDYRYRCW